MMKRRSFLKEATAASFSLMASQQTSFATERKRKEFVCTIGVQPPGMMPFRGQKHTGSMLQMLQIGTSDIQTIELNMRGAHSCVQVGDSLVVVGNQEEIQVLSKSWVPEAKIVAPQGYVFGGHGVALGEDEFLSSIYPSRDHKRREVGFLVKVHIRDKKVYRIHETGGYGPHDMLQLRSGHFVIANYGNRTPQDLQNYTSLKPTLSFFNESMTLLQTIDVPNFGSVSHICEAWDDCLVALPAKLQRLSQGAVDMVTQATQGHRPSVTLAEVAEGKIAFPSPVLVYQRKTQQWQSVFSIPAYHRRPQSLVFHEKTQTTWVTFSYSEQILRIDKDHQCRYLSAFELGIEIPRGVCVGGDGLIYVSGQSRGIVALDPINMSAIKRFPAVNFESTHIQSI